MVSVLAETAVVSAATVFFLAGRSIVPDQRRRFVVAAALLVVGLVPVVAVSRKKSTTDPLLQHIHQRLIELDPAAKHVYLVLGSRSFTRNKHMISICTRREDGTLYPMNDLMQVAIHELAHVKHDGDSSHHPDTWLAIFHDLLDRAHRMGICDKTVPVEDNYCGTRS